MNNEELNPQKKPSKIAGDLFNKILNLKQSKIGRISLVALVLATGAFLVVGRQEQSGAASPTEVGEKLVKAIEESDILGVIDIMEPGERDLLKEIFLDGATELDRLGIIKKSSQSQSKLFQYQIQNLQLQEQYISDDICNVTISGTVSGSLNGQTELGDVFRDSSTFDNIQTIQDLVYELTNNSSTSVQQNFDELTFTTIKHDGRWYASIGFTLAEQIRLESGKSLNATGLTLSGKETPEEAVNSLFRAIEVIDLRGVLQELDPREFAPAQRYADLFVPSLQRNLLEEDSLGGLDWDITNITTEVIEKSSSTAQVRIKELSIQITQQDYWDEDEITTEIDISHRGDDVRLSIRIDGESEIYQLKDFIDDEINKSTNDSNYEKFLDAFLSVTVNKRDGKWFVSPISSISKTIIGISQFLNQDDLRRLLNRLDN